MSLTEDLITFGKYNGKKLSDVLKNRSYCRWLLEQPWFASQYEYLYNRVKEYNPLSYFLTLPLQTTYDKAIDTFVSTYPYFHLKNLNELEIKLNETEEKCYTFYLQHVEKLKVQLQTLNDYNIKAPTKWLKELESNLGVTRESFKEFLATYELPNLTTIVEQIKHNGGLVYNGAKSYIIAKKKSVDQEQYWEGKLKEKYGEDLGSQYKFGNCIFDYVVIKQKTIFECKLGLKDFNEKQYAKYVQATDFFKVIYLIDTDCVIHIPDRKIYTMDTEKYLLGMCDNKINPKFTELLQSFQIVYEEHLENVI